MAASGFVGREPELRLLAAALDKAEGGRGSVTLLNGPPGQGKTHLATEVDALATERGFVVAWGRCQESSGAPPYWPWTQVLRQLRSGGLLDRADPAVLAAAGPLLPDLVLSRDVPPDPFRACDAVTQLLAGVGGPPRLLVLDDLHRADPASLRLLAFASTALIDAPVALIGTYRDDEVSAALAAVVGDLVTGMNVQLIALPGLGDAEIGLAVEHVTGKRIDATAAAQLRDRTGGNPFFVTQIARLGFDGPVPVSIREAIAARLRRLPDDTRRLLAVASVLGRDFDGQLLAQIAGAPTGVVDALGPAVDAALVGVDPDRPGRYRFGHSLLQEVLYGGLIDADRVLLHRRAAEVIDATARADRTAALDDLARHAVASAMDDEGRRRAAAVAVEAGERAVRLLAYDDAARWFGVALDLDASTEPLPLLLKRAEALAHCSAWGGSEAREAFELAIRVASERGDVATAGRAALGLGAIVASAGVVDHELVGTLESVEAATDDPALALSCAARRAIELYWLADRRAALDLAERTLEQAQHRDLPAPVLGEALHAMRFVLRGPDSIDRRIALGEQLVALAIESRDDDLALLAHRGLVPDRLTAGDIGGADRAIATLDVLERRIRRPLERWYVLVFQAMRAAFDGAYDTGLSLTDEAEVLGQRIGSQPAALYAVAQRAVVLRDLGRHDEAIAGLARMAADYPNLPTLQCELALFHAEAGDRVEAIRFLDIVARDHFAHVPRDALWLCSMGMVALAAAHLGRPEQARTAIALLEPYRGANLVQGLPNSFGAVDHYIGVALRLLDEAGPAVVALEAAVELHRRWGAAGFLARSTAELAAALSLRGRSDDSRRSRRLIASAGVANRELGASIPGTGSGAGAPRHGWESLTPREIEIISRLAGGEANKEIASALRISVHTVERHVSNAYLKLGVNNRVEAAAAARQTGSSSGGR